MRILSLIDYHPPYHDGGDGVLAGQMTEALRIIGHDVAVYVTHVRTNEENRAVSCSDNLSFCCRYPITYLTPQESVREAVNNIRSFDIVIVHQVSTLPIVRAICEASDIPIVFVLHIDFSRYAANIDKEDRYVSARIEEQHALIKICNSIIVWQVDAIPYLLKQNVDPCKISLLPPPLPIPQELSPKLNSVPVIGCGGRLDDPLKGAKELIKTVEHLLDFECMFRLKTIGRMNMEDNQAFVRLLGNRFECANWKKSHHSVIKFLSETDVFISLSKEEQLSLMAIEAISTGCLLVTTSSGFFSSLQSTDGIFIVPKESSDIPQIAATHLSKLLCDVERLRETQKQVLSSYKKLYCNGFSDSISRFLDNLLHSSSTTNSSNDYMLIDMVLFEDMCNLRCAYCWPKDSPCNSNDIVTQKTSGGISFNSNSIPRMRLEEMKLEDRVILASGTIKRLLSEFRSPVIRLSGGELFLLGEKLFPVIEEVSNAGRSIQLLTNGVSVPVELLIKMKTMVDFCIHISLDGHSSNMNKYRGLSTDAVKSILQLIRTACRNNIPVEINTVITDANCSCLHGFFKCLYDISHSILCWPFPVRGNPEYLPSQQQIDTLEGFFLADNRESAILPPKPYLDRLIDFLRNGKRRWSCYVPNFVLASWEDKPLGICPCEDIGSLGWVWEFQNLSKKSQSFSIDDLPPQCMDCFTHYEIYNLFVEKAISFDEMNSKAILCGQFSEILNAISITSET